jgi:hypothetical protein
MNGPMFVREAVRMAKTSRRLARTYLESTKLGEAQPCLNDDAPGFRKP